MNDCAYFKQEIHDEKDLPWTTILSKTDDFAIANQNFLQCFQMIQLKETRVLYLVEFNPSVMLLFLGLKTKWAHSLVGSSEAMSHFWR